MKNLKIYIYSQLSQNFFPIFMILFIITSIVFLVRIAQLTSVIKIDIIELLQLFSFVLPEILFYTIPISFVVSLAVTISRLSLEYELMVITSFGLKPTKILQILLPITLVFSVVMLIVSLGLIPKAKYLNKTMIEDKTKQASLNIKSSEFGQTFGDWQVYIENDENNVYYDLKLFKTQNNQDHFISAKKALTSNEVGEVNLILHNGKYIIQTGKEVNQVNFKTMSINNSIAFERQDHFTNSIIYWKNELQRSKKANEKFSFYVLTSIFPVLSLFFIVAIGYFNPRYEKNRGAIYAIVLSVLYYILALHFSEKYLLYSLTMLPLGWFVLGYLIYFIKVRRLY